MELARARDKKSRPLKNAGVKPKVKITGKASTSPGGIKSIKPGAINQSTKTKKSMGK
jgi:hypothetical protein